MDTKQSLFNAVDRYLLGSQLNEWTKDWLQEETPSYFWKIPASSTGKYHPSYALGEGGLVRHTISSMVIAYDLLDNSILNTTGPSKIDKVIAALAIHDTRKHGYPKKSKYSNASHGQDLCKAIKEKHSEPFYISIADLIAPHMGQWNKSYKTKKVVAPTPSTDLQKFVHLADYLASRKYLEVNFSKTPHVK